jgi:hypothetical protein
VTRSVVPQPFRHSRSTKAERRAVAREALAEMKGHQGWIAEVDDRSLDFLAMEISEQMMQQLARRWNSLTTGYPTPSNLAVMVERLQLEAAVAALDARDPRPKEMEGFEKAKEVDARGR